MRRNICRIALIVSIAVAFHSLPARAEKWTTFTTEDGLASNDVFAILEDREGKLWFGTLGGVSCYDGERWTTYTTTEGLAHNEVRAILEDRDGYLWFGTMEGVSRYDGKTWTTYKWPDLRDLRVVAISEDQEGNLWFGTLVGASCYDGERWTSHTWGYTWETTFMQANFAWAILEGRDGSLWFGTGRGVIRYNGEKCSGGKWTTYTTKDGLVNKWVSAISEDQEGNLWFGTSEGVSRYDGERWTTYTTETTEDGLVDNYVSAISEDQEGNLWFGTFLWGVSVYDGEIWTTYTAAEGLASNDVNAILEDREGSLWFGTGYGVSRYDKTWTTYTTEDGLTDNKVFAILEDQEGNLWFGTLGGGVTCYDGKDWITYTTEDGLVGSRVFAILEDRNRRLWFGTNGGVTCYDGKDWVHYPTGETFAIVEDREGLLWFGTMWGVTCYDGKDWITYTTEDGLGDNYVLAILEDREGLLWFGTRGGGVTCYDGKDWITYTTEDGLAGNRVEVISEDEEGRLWFGAWKGVLFPTGVGVSCYDGKQWTTYTTEDGLGDHSVYAILEDRESNLWFGSHGGGVSGYNGEKWTTYTTDDGLADHTVYGILEDRDGNLWFGTLNGVTRYRVDRSPPYTFVFDGPEGIIGVAQTFVQYGGGDRYAPGKDVQYSYAIKRDRDRPTEDDWSSFTTLTSLFTDPLLEGTYTFYVRTRDKAGNIDPTPAERTFAVDLTAPTVVIRSPSNADTVHGKVTILGSAFDNSEIPDFRNYTLEYAKGSDEDQIVASEWRSIREKATEPIVSGLWVWNTEGLYGTYVLRLRAVDGFDHRSKYAVTVHVVAAAEEMDPRQGGHITDAASKVDLYIPPNGIRQSTQVTISPVADEDVTKPSDPQLRLIGRVYDIGPRYLMLLKPPTFTIPLDRDDAQVVSDFGKLSIFTWSATDRRWERVGGTIDEETKTITVALIRLGRLAVMEDLSEEPGKLSISDVNCQPRVFSPEGGGYDNKTTISFNLGERSEVTVKVYDVSGRYKRKLIEGRTMNQGSNAAVWDGRDYEGRMVVSGLYVVTVEAGGKVATKTVGVLNK